MHLFRAAQQLHGHSCETDLLPRPAPWTVPLDFLEMIRWLHECIIFHPQQLLCQLPACTQAHVGWHCSKQGSQNPLVSFFYSSLFLSVLCIVPQWAWDHLGNSQPWLQMKSTKHWKFKFVCLFFFKFWFIFQKQRKGTIQNLDLIFLCRMSGLR